MNLSHLYAMGGFEDEKWSCSKCSVYKKTIQASHLHLEVKRSDRDIKLTFTGRCAKHKREGDVALNEIRAIFGSIPLAHANNLN